MNIKTDEKLDKLLKAYLSAGKKIEEYVKSNKAERFSTKKFVADLGEFYFEINCRHMFENLVQEKPANAAYDFKGVQKQEKEFKHIKRDLKIEVKTRHGTPGNPKLQEIKLDKFDILAFVHLNEDLTCRYICMMKRKDIEKKINKNANSLKYCEEIKTIWQTGTFEKIRKTKPNK